MTQPITLLTTIDDRIELLPFFLAYYARLGITRVIIGLWNGTDNPAYPELSSKLGQWTPGSMSTQILESIRGDFDSYSGVSETPWLNEMRLKHISEGDWYSVADLDEFYWFGGSSIPKMVEFAKSVNCNVVAGGVGDMFIDRIAVSGFPPVPVWGERTLDETFPYGCCISQALGCGTTKVALARQDVTIIPGHHDSFGHPRVENSVEVHHFKWNSNLPSLLMRRHLAYHKQRLPHAAESATIAQVLMNPQWSKDPRFNTRIAKKLEI